MPEAFTEERAQIRLLGEPRIFTPDGQAIHLPTIKTLATLAMILTAGKEGINRRVIGESLWSRSSEQQARTNLRQALSALRKALGTLAENIEHSGDLLWFRRGGFWLDIDLIYAPMRRPGADDFSALIEAGQFLEGIVINEPPFENWLVEKRARLNRLLQDHLERECERKLDDEDYTAAERISRKLIAMDNFNEAAHRARMRALSGCGEIATALKHFKELESLLGTELGVSPGGATIELAKKLRETEPVQTLSKTHKKPPVQSAMVGTAEPLSVESPTQPELRNVVMVAVDVSQKSWPSDDFDSQIEIIERISGVLSQVLQDFKGTELTNNGTSLLAVFGHPTAHSKDSERGLRFAQAALSSAEREMPGASVRVAMVSGIVLASAADGASVLGDPIRRAQALIHKTPEGQISADRGVFQATSGLAAYTVLDEELWSVALEPDELQNRDRTDFVGRDRELRQALELLDDVQEDRRGEVIVLRGEAGIGKTRLSQEIVQGAREQGFTIAACRVLDFGQGRKDNSLAMVASALSAKEPSKLNRIERAVWADLIAPDSLSNAERQLILELDQGSLLNEQTRILRHLARSRADEAPLLLVVEDVHWAHSNLMQALADIAASIDSLPIALMFTTRPENDPIDNTWRIRAGRTQTTTIDLQALRRRAALLLAKNLRDLDGDLLNLCLDRAAGNPLFIEQLVLWAEIKSKTNLPLSVQSVVQERLDKLPNTTRRLAHAASVLGQVFEADALEAVYSGDIGSAVDLDKAHLVLRRDTTFTFVHALVRDGIYASISPKDRQDLHLRAAKHFEERDAVLSARHHYWSGVRGAYRICFEAAKQQQRAGQLEPANELVLLALEGCDEDLERPRIQLLLGEILRDREQYSEAIDAFVAVEADDKELTLSAIFGAAESHFRIDNQDECERLLDKANTIGLAEKNAAWRTTLACLRSGVEFSRGNSKRSIEYAKTAMKASEDLDDKPLRVRALSTIADAEMVGGLFQSSERHFRECVKLCNECGLQRYGLSNQTLVAMLRFYDAEPNESFEIMNKTVEEARSINFSRAQMNGEHMLGYIQAARANYETAYQHWERARRLIEASSAKRFIMNSGCYAAMVMGPMGRTEEALMYLREAEQVADDLGLVWVLPWVLASKARWLDDPAEAAAALDRAQELVFSGKATYPFEFYYVGVDAALRLADWNRVETYVQRLNDYFANEPVGMPAFISKKASAIAAASQGLGEAKQISSLIAIAEAKGLIEARNWLEQALGRCDSNS